GRRLWYCKTDYRAGESYEDELAHSFLPGVSPVRRGDAYRGEPGLNAQGSTGGGCTSPGFHVLFSFLLTRIALKGLMTETVLIIGGVIVTAGEALAGFASIVLALLALVAIMLARVSRTRGEEAERRDIYAGELEERMAEIARIQSDTAGRVHTMGEVLSGRQAELARAVSERLDAVTHRLGQSMQAST